MRTLRGLAAFVLILSTAAAASTESRGLTFERLAALRRIEAVTVSPSGHAIAFLRSVPRPPGSDDDGPPWSELHVARPAEGRSRPFVTGEIKVTKPEFGPRGTRIYYLAKRDGAEKTGVWSIAVDGGESRKELELDEDVQEFRVSPDGSTLAVVAYEPRSERKTDERDAGYDQEVYEEDWRPRRLYLVPLATDVPPQDPARIRDRDDDTPKPLPVRGSVFDVEWAPGGEHLVVTVAATPLIDDRYMARRIRVIEARGGGVVTEIDNPGKLGKLALSPDGTRVALISAADFNDPREGRLLVADVESGEIRDLLPGLVGHVRDFAWKDAGRIRCLVDVGVETEIGEVSVTAGRYRREYRSSEGGLLPGKIAISGDGRIAALTMESAAHPPELFVLRGGSSSPERLTTSNPWLADVTLGKQEVYEWTARDGLRLEGLLLHPASGSRRPAPLLLMVHGGPESHDRNGFVSSYSRPGQLAAAHGYRVLYPNYRGSTGRGVEFSKSGQGDAAGAEFDDLIDAVEALVRDELVDGDRVGILGGSYGGYATAWCSTRYTSHFRAGVMFVGISNKVSKGFTTEIPVEDRAVHTRFDPWTRWEFSLERSPLYHAEKSRTALLIAAGTDDTRVHPSQSLQLYRALKLMGNTPVRYVRYPGEGHGNRRASARDDYTRRLMRWMNHFVRDRKDGLPPVDLDLPHMEKSD